MILARQALPEFGQQQPSIAPRWQVKNGIKYLPDCSRTDPALLAKQFSDISKYILGSFLPTKKSLDLWIFDLISVQPEEVHMKYP